MRKEQFDITGMTCSACSSRKVKLPRNVTDEVFQTAVETAGYQLTKIN